MGVKMKVPSKITNLPLRDWVSSEILNRINDFIEKYTKTKDSSTSSYAEGIKNSHYLRDIYLYEYMIVYTLRTHPELNKLISDLELITSKHNGERYSNQEFYWRDTFFSGSMIDKILSGGVIFPGVEFSGELSIELVKPLLTDAPPLQGDIKNLLHNNIYNLLEKYISSLVTDTPEEIFTAAQEITDQLIITKRDQYATSYRRREDIMSEFIDSSIPSYDLWYTQRGTSEKINMLLRDIDIKIKDNVDKTLQGMHTGYEKVEKSGLEIARKVYDDMIELTQFYWNKVDYTTITDNFINLKLKELARLTHLGTSELPPNKRDVSGIMMVKAENKFLKAFTMREIAMGLPQRESSLFNSISFDYNGVDKIEHSNTFERMIRELPDQVEAFLLENGNKITKDTTFRTKLSRFYKITLQFIVEGFLLKSQDTFKKHFGDPIKSFMAGVAQPNLVNIGRYELADLICIKSLEEDNNPYFFFASILTGECKIVSSGISSVRKDAHFQQWLLQHLPASDRFNTTVTDEFLEFKNIIIGHQIIRVPNKYPLNFISTDNHQNDLCYRHSRKILSDADSLIKTSSESARGYILDFVTLSLSVLSITSTRTLLGFITQFIVGTAGITATEVLRFYNSDNKYNEDDIFWNVLTNLIFGLIVNAGAVVSVLKKQLSLQISAEKLVQNNDFIPRLHVSKIVKIHMDQSYKKAKNLITEGATSKVYKLNSECVIKEYTKLIQYLAPKPVRFGENTPRFGSTPLVNNSLLEANNSAVAFNRLHGSGSASLILFDGPDAYTKLVSLRMKRLPGESLTSLLSKRNKHILEKLKANLSEFGIDSIADDILKPLKYQGIAHHDINLSNIIFDTETNTYSLVDFDSAVINPIKNSSVVALNMDKYDLMKSKLIGDLRECYRRCDEIVGL